ncbi:MAG TPA: right-handed parallel beta-helix repeat-containing protein, partial [Isosphaeraceae bacterium]|nr:right-handed parallel beta-helix repeat-containing protein [Isosphaeraceae bacterium]
MSHRPRRRHDRIAKNKAQRTRRLMEFRPLSETLEERRLLSTVYVDKNYDTAAGASDGSSAHPWTTIALGLADTHIDPSDGVDTLVVAAGTYDENVTVNEAVDIQGAKHGQDARTRGYTGESIIKGSVDVTAAGVTLDGFTLTNSTATDSEVAGITVEASTAAAPTVIKNNFIHDLRSTSASSGSSTVGILVQGTNTSDVKVSQNYVYRIYGDQNLSNQTYGISASSTGANIQIQDNKVQEIGRPANSTNTGVTNAKGINVTVAGTGLAIQGNSISDVRARTLAQGIQVASASNATVQDNTIERIGDQVGDTPSQPNANADAVYLSNTSGVVFQGNTISYVRASNIYAHGLVASDAANAVIKQNVIQNVTLTNSGDIQVGMSITGSSSGTVASHNQITGVGSGSKGAAVDVWSTGVSVTENDLSGNGNAAYALTNHSSGLIDASANYWGVTTESAVAALIANFNSSGTTDYTPWLKNGTDISGDSGFQPDLSYLYVGSGGAQTSGGRVQEAVNLLADGPSAVIEVSPGTYDGNISISNKQLTLQGPNAVTPASGSRSSEATLSSSTGSVLTVNSTLPVTVTGFTIAAGGGNTGISVLGAGGTTIKDNILTGTSSTSGTAIALGETAAGVSIDNSNSYTNFFQGIAAANGAAGSVLPSVTNFSGVTELVYREAGDSGIDQTALETALGKYARSNDVKPSGSSPANVAYYATIQNAIDDSNSGATIDVSAGTFNEQLSLTDSLTSPTKANLTIQG